MRIEGGQGDGKRKSWRRRMARCVRHLPLVSLPAALPYSDHCRAEVSTKHTHQTDIAHFCVYPVCDTLHRGCKTCSEHMCRSKDTVHAYSIATGLRHGRREYRYELQISLPTLTDFSFSYFDAQIRPSDALLLPLLLLALGRRSCSFSFSLRLAASASASSSLPSV